MCGLPNQTNSFDVEISKAAMRGIFDLIALFARDYYFNSSQTANNDNVLASAANAFRSGKITQQQYFQIIDTLNQCDVSNAGNQEFITANRLLAEFR